MEFPLHENRDNQRTRPGASFARDTQQQITRGRELFSTRWQRSPLHKNSYNKELEWEVGWTRNGRGWEARRARSGDSGWSQAENSDQSSSLQVSPSSDNRDCEGTRQDQPQKRLVAIQQSTLVQAGRRGGSLAIELKIIHAVIRPISKLLLDLARPTCYT